MRQLARKPALGRLQPPLEVRRQRVGKRAQADPARAASGRDDRAFGLLALVTYLILAPFTGADAARDFVEGKVREIQANHSSGPARAQ
jgi:hypothetical protein